MDLAPGDPAHSILGEEATAEEYEALREQTWVYDDGVVKGFIRVDDGEIRKLSVLLIAAANGKYYGGGMPISLDAECDDGYIDLVIIKKLPRIKIPYIFIKFSNIHFLNKNYVFVGCDATSPRT